MKFSEMTLDDLRELDLGDAGSWPVAIRAILFAIIVAAIGGLGYKFLIADQVVALQAVQNEEKALRGKLERKQKKVATLEALKEQVKKLERDFASLRDQLPGKTEVASLLQEVSQTRVITGLEEELFKPGGEIPKDFYAELPIELRVLGSYHQFGEFVSGIAALPRIVTLHKIKIVPNPQADEDDARPLIMTATAKTYRYRDESERTPEEPAK